jgi:hypothetical protein
MSPIQTPPMEHFVRRDVYLRYIFRSVNNAPHKKTNIIDKRSIDQRYVSVMMFMLRKFVYRPVWICASSLISASYYDCNQPLMALKNSE